MKFASTRDPNHVVGFREAVFRGLAPDGGLYHPTSDPDLRDLIASFGARTSFVEIASTLTDRLLGEDLPPGSAERIAAQAFTFSPGVTELDGELSILDLSRGPSCAFKDYGASFLAAVMEEYLRDEERTAVILTATSGDTGSAVARAFHGRRNIAVVILYPSGRVSPLQERQLTTVGGNVIALEVKGSFDDCQRMVKDAFVDPLLSTRIHLTSANSINLGRLIPQAFYYVYGHALLKDRSDGELVFTVPSGNFGNLTAGVYAWRWGMPVAAFVAATNANDVVPEYLARGIYCPRASVLTLSNAMDVGNPSNFERLRSVFGDDLSRMRSLVHGEVVTDEETLRVMAETRERYGLFVDPHTAVGILASRRYLALGKQGGAKGTRHVLALSTAHPGKFSEVVEEATGLTPELPERLARVLSLPKEAILIGNTHEEFSRFLLDRFADHSM